MGRWSFFEPPPSPTSLPKKMRTPLLTAHTSFEPKKNLLKQVPFLLNRARYCHWVRFHKTHYFKLNKDICTNLQYLFAFSLIICFQCIILSRMKYRDIFNLQKRNCRKILITMHSNSDPKRGFIVGSRSNIEGSSIAGVRWIVYYRWCWVT